MLCLVTDPHHRSSNTTLRTNNITTNTTMEAQESKHTRAGSRKSTCQSLMRKMSLKGPSSTPPPTSREQGDEIPSVPTSQRSSRQPSLADSEMKARLRENFARLSHRSTDSSSQTSDGKRRGKSFSEYRESRVAAFNEQLRVARANVKSALHAITTPRDRDASHNDNNYPFTRFQEAPTRRVGDPIPVNQRPWTSLPYDAVSPEVRRSLVGIRLGHESPPVDPVGGDAARQSARNSSRVYEASAPMERHDSSTEIHLLDPNQNRESGISLGMDGLTLSESRPSTKAMSVRPRLDPVSQLPDELISQLLSFLDLKALLNASRVSWSWNRFARDPLLHKQVFLKKWDHPAVVPLLPAPVGGAGLGRQDLLQQEWMHMYRARKELDARWRRGPVNQYESRAIYLNGHQDSVYCVQFDEEKVITGSRDRTIRVWDVHTGGLLKVIGVPEALENDHSRSSIVGTQSALLGPMRVYNFPPRLHDPRLYHTPSYYHNASILCLQYDEKMLVTGSSDTTLIVWDIQTWEPQRILRGHTAGVLDIAFDSTKIVSCSKDGTVCIWDRVTGKRLAQLQGHRGPVNAVQLRNNKVVSASGEGCAKLWQLQHNHAGTAQATCTAKCVRDLWSKEKGLACVEFSLDGAFVYAGGNDHVIYKFSTTTGEQLDAYPGHRHLVRSLYLDGLNSRIMSGSYDLDLRCYDTRENVQLWCLQRWSSSWILSAKCDYRRVVTTSQDGRALILDFGVGIPGVDLLRGKGLDQVPRV